MRDVRLAPVYYPHSHAHRYAVSLLGLVQLYHSRLNKKFEDLPPKYPSDYLRALDEALICGCQGLKCVKVHAVRT